MPEQNLKVLVTGADGFVGRHLMEHLAQRAISAVAATRNGSVFAGAGAVAIGDLSDRFEWSAALNGVTHVVHLAGRAHILRETAADPEAAFHAVNATATERLAQAARLAGVKHFILLSSIAVFDPHLAHVAAATLEAPASPYGRSKLAAEQALIEAAGDALTWTILRPPLVYGPGVGARFLHLLKLAALPWPLPLGRVRNKRSLIFVGNLTDAIITSLTHPGACNQRFLVSDGQDISTPDLVTALAAAMRRRASLWPVPKSLCDLGVTIIGQAENWRKLTGTLTLDTTEFQSATGWLAPVPLVDALGKTARWFVESGTN